MLKYRKTIILSMLLILVLATSQVFAYSSSFDLDNHNTSYSSKGSLWYFDYSTVNFGVSNFSGGEATVKFRKVIEYWPDSTLCTFNLKPSASSMSETVHVTNSNGYYYVADRVSGYPKGNVYCD